MASYQKHSKSIFDGPYSEDFPGFKVVARLSMPTTVNYDVFLVLWGISSKGPNLRIVDNYESSFTFITPPMDERPKPKAFKHFLETVCYKDEKVNIFESIWRINTESPGELCGPLFEIKSRYYRGLQNWLEAYYDNWARTKGIDLVQRATHGS